MAEPTHRTEPVVGEPERATGARAIENRATPLSQVSFLEFKPTDRTVVLTFSTGETLRVAWSEAPPFGAIPTRTQLPAGEYRCVVKPEGVFEVNDIIFHIPRLDSMPARARKAIEQSGTVPCRVTWPDAPPLGDRGLDNRALKPGGSVADPSAAGPPAPSFRVEGNVDLLGTDDQLRGFVWELLSHFASPPKKPAASATLEDVKLEVARDPRAAEIVARATQAWREHQRARSRNFDIYKRLTETLVEQWMYGNATVRLNRLALRDEPDGWGLYHRGSGIKLYDQLGMPVASFMGTLWEKHYQWSDHSQSAKAPLLNASPDDPIFSILEAFRAGGIPDPSMIGAAAKGYFNNAELLRQEIRRHPAKWENVAKGLHEQVIPFAIFLGLEGLATLLEAHPHPGAKLVGAALRLLIRASVYFFNVTLVRDGTNAILEIGCDLYRVKRGNGGELDRLSQRHLEDAAERTRALAEEAAVLVAQLAAAFAAKGISRLVPPGSGGPVPQLQMVATPEGLTFAFERAGTGAAVPGLVLMGGGTGRSPRDEKKTETKPAKPPEVPREVAEEVKRAQGESDREWQVLEEELKDYLNRAPKAADELRYANRRASTVFEDVLKQLEARAQNDAQRGSVRDARAHLDRLFNQTRTVDRLLTEVGLKRPYDKYEAHVNRRLARALDDLKRAKRNLVVASDEPYEIARDEVKYLDRFARQLRQFREGDLSRRVFDGVQVFAGSSKVAITDATMRVKEPFHQMKSLVYAEMWRSVFPTFKVEIWEFKSKTAMYEVVPTSDFARQIERAVDVTVAREGAN